MRSRFSSWTKTFAELGFRKLSDHQRDRAMRRRDGDKWQGDVERLEDRMLLNSVPIATHDPIYSTLLNTTLNVTTFATGILANDFDAEGTALTGTIISNPTGGTLQSFSATNGTFNYLPTTGFQGIDSFTYRVSDGVNNSSTVRVRIAVGGGFGPRLNLDDRTQASVLHNGVLTAYQPMSGDFRMIYRSDTVAAGRRPVIPVDMFKAIGSPTVTSMTAQLTFAGAQQPLVSYSNVAAFNSSTASAPVRFALQAASGGFTTGMHDWSMALIAGTNSTTSSGSQAVVDRSQSEFGNGWWLDGLDRLFVQANGALLVRGNGSTLWFVWNTATSTYNRAEGDLSFAALTTSGGTFKLTDKWGDEQNFDTGGYLTSVKRKNNNVASFNYAYVSNRISTITDEFGRVANFRYNVNGKMDLFTDFFGRETEFVYELNERVVCRLPVNDFVIPGHVGFDTQSVWTCGYSSGLLISIAETQGFFDSFTYDSTKLLSSIVHNDSTSWSLVSTAKAGLPTATTNQTVLSVSLIASKVTDERGNIFFFKTDRFGNVSEWKDGFTAITKWEYSPDSLLYRLTDADPDGTVTTLTSPITKYGYNSLGDLVVVVNPDNSTVKATYDAALHRVLSIINELNKTQLFTYDVNGNMLTHKDELLNTWTNTYNVHGYMLTETSPDPVGPALSSITTYVYPTTGIYSRLTSIINPDSSTLQFAYTNEDLVLSSTNEIGQTTNYLWDIMDRLRTIELPDPDGNPSGPKTTSKYKYTYNTIKQVTKIIDPNSNATEYVYNNRNWLSEIKYKDLDGIGGLPQPIESYVYDPTGNVTFVHLPTFSAGIGTTNTYDLNGRMLTSIGPISGQVSAYSYDFLGRTTSMQDSSGRKLKYEFDVRSRLTKDFDHDPDGTGPKLGPLTQYAYDLASRLTGITDAIGRTTNYAYLDNGWLSTVTLPDPDGTGAQIRPVHSYGYDEIGRNTLYTDPLGRQTLTAYDNRHRVNVITLPDPDAGGGILSPITTFGYDVTNRLTSVVEPMGRTTVYAYDNIDRLITVTMPDPDDGGGLTSPVYGYDYDPASNLTMITNPLGITMAFAYDGLNRRTSMTEAANSTLLTPPVWNYAYGANTLISSITDPLAHVTNYEYDSAGRNTSITDPLANQSTFQYDTLDRLTGVTTPDPDGIGVGQTPSTTSYSYDVYSRLSTITDPLGLITTHSYDDAHQLLSLKDPNGNETRWAFDGLGRATIESNPLGNERSFEYNAVNSLTLKTDRNGRYTQFANDNLDRTTAETWFNTATAAPFVTNATTTQGSATANEVQTVTLANLTSGTFRLAFDGQTTAPIAFGANAAAVDTALEALQSVDLVTVTKSGSVYTITFTGAHANTNVPELQGDAKLGTAGTQVRALAFGYDDASRLTSASDPAATYAYTLDKLDRITTELHSIVGLTPQVKLDSTFDAASNRLTLGAKLIVGATTTNEFLNAYVFDDLNRMSSVTQTAQAGAGAHVVADKLATLSYNALGQFTFISRFQNATGTGTTLRSVYTYDGANRLATLIYRNILSGGGANILHQYTLSYDGMSRITAINSTLDGISSFGYDKRDQLTLGDHAAPRFDEGYTYDSNGNRTGGGYVNAANNQTTADGTYTYLYDKEGNRTRRTKVSDGSYEEYTWDHRNRLTKVSFKTAAGVETKSVTYSYDVFNRLIRRQHDADGSGPGVATNLFLVGYDGINPTLAFDGTATSDVSNRYLWGPAIDQLLADEQVTVTTSAGNVIYPLTDHLGTIRDLVDFNEATLVFTIANHRVFDSFGKLTSETNPAVDESFAYTGKYFDEVTQLSNHWNRWYDPKLGKWLSEDPIGFWGGDVNLLRYVQNNCQTRSDSLGLFTDELDEIKRKIDANKREIDRIRKHKYNLEKSIARRKSDLARNPLNLPATTPDDHIFPSKSRRGHELLISRDYKSLVLVDEQLAKKQDFARKLGILLSDEADKIAKAKKLAAKKAGKVWKIGRKVAKAIPVVGTVLTIFGIGSNVHAKGLVNGGASSALDAIPVVGTGKNIIEIFTGDFIRDLPDADEVEPQEPQPPSTSEQEQTSENEIGVVAGAQKSR